MPVPETAEIARPLRVISHESETDRWLMAEAQPDPSLRGLVLDYCEYEESTTSFRTRRELPSGRVIMILNLGPPLGVTLPSVDAAPTSYSRGFFAGLHDSYVLTDSGGYQHGIEVAFSPIGAHLILGFPMHETASRVVELEDAFGPAGPELLEQVAAAGSRQARFAIIEAFLISRVADAPPPAREVAFAWRRLRASRGAASVGAIADELGWSHRRLIAGFREQVGVAPKLMGRIFRFEWMMRVLREPAEMGWAEIALECGYYDQAHLIRDVRQFAGATPTELASRLLPDGGGVVGD